MKKCSKKGGTLAEACRAIFAAGCGGWCAEECKVCGKWHIVWMPVAVSLMLMCNVLGTTLEWNPQSDAVSWRIYRNGVFAVASGTTTATLATEAGDTLTITAVSPTGVESDHTAPVVAPPPSLNRTGWTIAGFSSEEIRRESTAAVNAIDGNPATFWHSVWEALPPHYIAVKLPRNAMVSGLTYLPRQDGIPNGSIQSWEVQSSMDGLTWDAWGKGMWSYDAAMKRAELPLREIRYFRLWGTEGYCNAAELWLTGSYSPHMRRITPQWCDDLNRWNDGPSFEMPETPKGFLRFKIENADGTTLSL